MKPDDLSKLTDAELDSQVFALEKQHDEMRALKKKPFADDSHRAIDETVVMARQQIDRLLGDAVPRLASSGGLAVWVPGLGDAWALANDPTVAQRWHQLVDANAEAGAYSAMTRAEYNAERERLQGEVARRRTELHRRGLVRQRAALDAELGVVEA